MTVLFLIFWIRSVQNRSNMIKLDQIGFSQQSKNVTIKSCHNYRKDKNGCFILIFLRSDPSKMDQTCTLPKSNQERIPKPFAWILFEIRAFPCLAFFLYFFGHNLRQMPVGSDIKYGRKIMPR